MSSDDEQPRKLDGPFYDNYEINQIYDSDDEPPFLMDHFRQIHGKYNIYMFL